ncbi:MAG: hypothetical protein EOP54_12080 [Sphingobacteriales bacterium]|nr:MAG: hypothetical protein EOP54_12080 [Sphingobacteriales bacterium]
MKYFLKLSTLLLVASSIFLSCKKDKENEPQFDINSPAGYVVAGKFSIMVQGNLMNIPIVFEFLANQKVKLAYIEGTGDLDYIVSKDTILLNGIKLLIKDDRVTYFRFGQDEHANYNFKLLKKPASNTLRGKTFAGTYYNPDNTVLHPDFFYGFHASEDKVAAGYTVGAPVRTETYTPVGNVAALVHGNGFNEFMLLNEGKLEAMYLAAGGGYQYATLSPQ